MVKHNFKNKKVIIHEWDFPEGDTKAWEEQRRNLQQNGNMLKFGASSVAQVCGQNKYDSAYNLFQTHLGKGLPKRPNIIMLHGNEVENIIMKYAMSYDLNDTSEEQTAENFIAKNYQRNIEKAEYFLESEEYPAILVSLDGVLFKGEQEFDGTIAKSDIPCEFKNVTASSFFKWNGEIPIEYFIQTQVQLAFTGAPHLWFVVLVDNRELWIRKVKADKEWFKYINEQTIDLSNRITEAKQIQEKIGEHLVLTSLDVEVIEDYKQQIYDLAPEPTHLESDLKLLKYVYSNGNGEVIEGSDSDLQLAKDYLEYSELEKENKRLKDLTKNTLLNVLKDNSKLEMFDEDGIYSVMGGARFSCKFKKHKEKKD